MQLCVLVVGFIGIVVESSVRSLPMRPCRRCGVAHGNANGYCDKHQALAVGWTARQKGKTTTQRGYGYAWRLTRDRVLRRDKYCCVMCGAASWVVPATDVDHIVPKEFGGDDSDDNLQSLCKDHHKVKTQSESALSRKNGKGGGILKV